MLTGLLVTSFVLVTVSLGCFFIVLRDAFRLGVGPGFMVLLIPGYNLYYAFAQFHHRHKGLILAGWLGLLALAVMLRVVALSSATSMP